MKLKILYTGVSAVEEFDKIYDITRKNAQKGDFVVVSWKEPNNR